MHNTCILSKGKRGKVLPPPPPDTEADAAKARITIQLDRDILERFFEIAEQSGGATGYQTLINAALRQHLERTGRTNRTDG